VGGCAVSDASPARAACNHPFAIDRTTQEPINRRSR